MRVRCEHVRIFHFSKNVVLFRLALGPYVDGAIACNASYAPGRSAGEPMDLRANSLEYGKRGLGCLLSECITFRHSLKLALFGPEWEHGLANWDTSRPK